MSRIPVLRLPFALAMTVVVLILQSASNHSVRSTAGFATARAFAATAPKLSPEGDSSAAPRVSSSYEKLPISFEANAGQTAGGVQYLARGRGYTLFLTPGEMVLALRASQPGSREPNHEPVHSALIPSRTEGAMKSAAVRMRLIGSNHNAAALGLDPLPGKSNYFMGGDPSKWRTDIPTYAKVRYHDVYPGIDLAYYGNQAGKLEHDFVVAPGADPKQISFVLGDSHGRVRKDAGELRLQTIAGDLEMKRPVAYQTIGGRKRFITADYEISTDKRIGFRVGKYDRQSALVIDPVLVYAAVFGGSSEDVMNGLTIDSSHHVYVTGFTFSTDFPIADPYQPTWTPDYNFPTTTAAFVSKINPSGTALLYSTYLGGPSTSANAVAVDKSGRAYVSGGTSSGFPLKNAYQPTYGGGDSDAFISVLSPAGDSLEWSTYLGGAQPDYTNAMAVDELGNVYVSGRTEGNFPALHSMQPQGTPGIWVAKFNSSGVLQYSSMYGNILGQSAGMAVDATGAAYVVGYTNRPDLPTTPGAFRSTCPINTECAWAAKFNPSGDSLAYSTYLGANGAVGAASAIALDSGLNAYVGGATGPGLPVWSSGFQRSYGGGDWDGFVVKLNASGSKLIWSTYLGGNGMDQVNALALDRYRTVYVGGATCSSNFPLKAPIQTWKVPASNQCGMFVTTLSASLSSIPYYSTYFGAPSSNNIQPPSISGIAVDPLLNVYVGGVSNNNVQPTPGALSTGSTKGGAKVFLAKLAIMDDLALALSASPTDVAHGGILTYTIGVTSKGPDFGYNVRIGDTLPAGTTLVSYDAGGGTCSAPAVGTTGTLNCALAQLNAGSSWSVKLTVRVNATPGFTLSNTAATISNMQDPIVSNNFATITIKVN